MRSNERMKRGAALILTAATATLGPVSVSLPVMAQENRGDDGYYAAPPPVDMSALPNDTGKPDQNYQQEVGCVQRDLDRDITLQRAPWGQQYLRISEVHKLMQATVGSVGKYEDGTPVRVAVIDTGITGSHPFFDGRVKPGGEYVHNSGEPGMQDCDGHGTEVAGIIGANTPPDIGFNGVAPDVEILSIRQSSQNYAPDNSPPPPAGGEDDDADDDTDSSADGLSHVTHGQAGTTPAQGNRTQEDEGTAGNLDTLAQAVRRAADLNVDVINISINNCRPANGSIGSGERKLQAAVRYATDEKDVVIVSAAGNLTNNCQQNDQKNPDRPKTIVTPPWFSDDVLSVAAVDSAGSVANFSIHGPWVSVAAPGTEIVSLDPVEGSSGLANLTVEGDGEPQAIQGTSFAAPYVAGLASLVRAKYPHLDARQVMHRIKFTAQHPAAEGGRDNFVGHGIIDPMAALSATVPAEQGLPAAEDEVLPSNMPSGDEGDRTPMVVALTGFAGALVALIVTMFVVHTIRRNRA